MNKTVRYISPMLVFFLFVPFLIQADATSSIQQQIDQQNQQISQLDQQIAQYQTQLDAASEKQQTLQSQLSQLSTSIKKTTASITLTNTQISQTKLQIQQLSTGITQTQGSINDEQGGLAESLRTLVEEENEPLIVQLLAGGTLSDFWNDFVTTESLQSAVSQHITDLAADKQNLTNTKSSAQQKQKQLVTQQTNLQTQKGSLNAQQQAQNQLLTQTKSQESTYQSLIAQKKAQEASFEQALSDLKSQYNQAVNPVDITQPAPGLLQWPICPPINGIANWPTCGETTVTQFFGDTPFAEVHAALYSGHGHDGLDIAAAIGTPVHAALTGVILATGNTDATKGCQGGSFGKWVMIKHNDGLNTMYAHLSEIDVTPGQTVTTGEVIGYSGETGYAIGPHLHFGVYVSAVTQIIPLGQATGGDAPCSKAIMPVPPVSGYLNPLNYLPATPYKTAAGA